MRYIVCFALLAASACKGDTKPEEAKSKLTEPKVAAPKTSLAEQEAKLKELDGRAEKAGHAVVQAQADLNAEATQEVSLLELVEIADVALQEPAEFWRDGEQREASDTVMIRVRVNDVFRFLPGGAEPPHFVVGDAVAEMVRSPLGDSIAVILVPKDAVDAEPRIWTTPRGTGKKEVTSQWRENRLRHLRERRPREILELPVGRASALRLENIGAVRRQLREQKTLRPAI